MTATPPPRRFSLCNCGFSHGPSLNRRDLLAGGAATLALGAAVTSGFMPKAVAQAKPHRIDVHHHISPPTWLDALKSMKKDSPPLTNWSVQKTIEDMDAGGVAIAMTSPTTPQLQGLDAPTAARIARESNEYAKKLETDHPGRFGTWAMLPLPHVDESLKAIEYAFDTLKVDGVGIMTSYGDKWLGYQEFEPVWQELNRRKATVYTHPTGANCCVNLVRNVDEAYIEFGTDTTRSIFTIIFSGFAEKYPDINWIWSHGGGSITALYERFTVQALMRPPYKEKFTRDQVEKQIRRFYYDTAAIPNDVTLSALAKMVPVSQILYGTDFPYRRAAEYTKPLAGFFKADDLKAVDRENALRLVPRFKTA
ncbi:MAG TPA: amidohydrolase family protein [Bradyrhizobium sp.]|jgi:predicted TIM-barrel fold metal-dependent hydrolase|nr:amidohydrolase family protein [Bradyrhizobium sp.]